METITAIAAVGFTSFAGSYFTRQSVDTPWYACIRPEWAPAAIVFPIVWTSLYILLAIALRTSILVDSPSILALHALNLILNVLWCWVFFDKRQVKKAVAVLFANLLVALGIVYMTQSNLVYYCLVPYIGWLCFATLLNVQSTTKYKQCNWRKIV